MTAGPPVSVVIPAHNSAATLGRAIDSALAQTSPVREVLVVDDVSHDDTPRIAQAYAARGVRLVTMPQRGGASGARNAGIFAAQGDLIAFLDSDDEWLADKLARQLPPILDDPRVAFVSCGAGMVMPDGTEAGDLYPGRSVVAGPSAWKALLAANYIATPTVLVWRRHLLALDGFDPTLKVGEDQDMWIRLALLGSLAYVPEPLVRVHMRPDSLSSGDFRDQLRYTLPMIERHLDRLADRLAPSERRRILGERLGRLGRAAYGRGEIAEGARLVWQSARLGYRPASGALILLRHAPPMRWLERRLRPGRAR